MVSKFIDNCEREHHNNKIPLLGAVRFVAEAWCYVTAETIQNYFFKSGIDSSGKYIN